MCIRPCHLVYRCEDLCFLEPYLPSRFARQFGYDQLYVGGPNYSLEYEGNLIDGAQAWRYYISSGTGASFHMPAQSPSYLCTLAYCQWYSNCGRDPAGFQINQSGVKLLQSKGRLRRQSRGRGRGRGRNKGARTHKDEGYLSDIPSEGSGAGDNLPAPEDNPVVDEVFMAAANVEEEEDDDVSDHSDSDEETTHSVHFKRYGRKRKHRKASRQEADQPLLKRIRKVGDITGKPLLGKEGEVSEYVPPPGPVKHTSGIFHEVLSKNLIASS